MEALNPNNQTRMDVSNKASKLYDFGNNQIDVDKVTEEQLATIKQALDTLDKVKQISLQLSII